MKQILRLTNPLILFLEPGFLFSSADKFPHFHELFLVQRAIGKDFWVCVCSTKCPFKRAVKASHEKQQVRYLWNAETRSVVKDFPNENGYCIVFSWMLRIKMKLLPPIRAAEIVECVRKYMDGISKNLQSLSSY